MSQRYVVRTFGKARNIKYYVVDTAGVDENGSVHEKTVFIQHGLAAKTLARAVATSLNADAAKVEAGITE